MSDGQPLAKVTFTEMKGFASKTWNFLRKGFTIEIIAFLVIVGLCVYVFVRKPSPKTAKPTERTSELRKMLDDIEEMKLCRDRVSNDRYSSGEWSSSYDREDLGLRQRKPKKPKVFKMQERCREIFQEIFDKPFPSVRPDFLKNPTTGENLELDGYCEPLKLAFEYDGVQHSSYNPYFHKRGAIDFKYQLLKDDFKSKKAKLEGITLVRIPHYIHRDNLKPFILRRLKELGVLKR